MQRLLLLAAKRMENVRVPPLENTNKVTDPKARIRPAFWDNSLGNYFKEPPAYQRGKTRAISNYRVHG